MSNGGVVGKNNDAIASSSSGVWSIDEVFLARSRGSWPPYVDSSDFTYVTKFILDRAVGGVQGVKYERVAFHHIVGEGDDGRFTVTTADNRLTMSTAAPAPRGAQHRLNVGDEIYIECDDQNNMPVPLAHDVRYFVESTPTDTSFTLAEAKGGSQINLTSSGVNTEYRIIYKIPKPLPQWQYVGTEGSGRFTVNISTNHVTIPGHGFSVNDEFIVHGNQGDMPTAQTGTWSVQAITNFPVDGLGASPQRRFVKQVIDANTITVSATGGGAEYNFLTTGDNVESRQMLKKPYDVADPSINFEIFHYSDSIYPTGLQVNSLFEVGEDVDDGMRITAVVVDRNINIESAGTLRITNNRERLGFFLFSYEDIILGGTWTIPNMRNLPKLNAVDPNLPAPLTTSADYRRQHHNFRRYAFDPRLPGTSNFMLRGANGGAGGAGSNPSVVDMRGGSGGSSWGGISGFSTVGGTPVPSSGFGTGAGSSTPHNTSASGAGNPIVGPRPGTNIQRGYALLYGNTITLNGPAPTIRVDVRGGQGGASATVPYTYFSRIGPGGGGSGGGNVIVMHAGAYNNNATISVAGGPAGPGTAPGGATQAGAAGTVVVQPIPTVSV